MPSGRNCGRARSGLIGRSGGNARTRVAGDPGRTRCQPSPSAVSVISTRMAPLDDQVPAAQPAGTSATVSGGAPAIPTVLIVFPVDLAEKKPIERLSGDQKGSLAPSVPSRATGSASSSERTQSRPREVKARWRPSGEIAAGRTSSMPREGTVRSRWTIPFSCAASSASAIWRAMARVSSRGRARASAASARSSPSTSSMTSARMPLDSSRP